MKDLSEVFAFSGPDVKRGILSNGDPKFKGKVILAIVTGPWCPNCNDEAQYLVQLYKKYRDRGLEIVALDFEEPEQQDDLARVHAFIKQYGVEYTYLIEGAPAEMWEMVPQPVNLNTWPATVFVGRNGRVDHVHVGFAAPASREFNDQLKVGVHLHDRAVARRENGRSQRRESARTGPRSKLASFVTRPLKIEVGRRSEMRKRSVADKPGHLPPAVSSRLP